MKVHCFSLTLPLLFASLSFPAAPLAIDEGTPTDETPVLEVIDHSRGMKIVTVSDSWSFSPLGKYGITMVHDPGFSTLRFKQESFSGDAAEIRDKYLEQERQNENSEILVEDVKLKVGSSEAVGISFYVPQSKKKFIRAWYSHGEQGFRVELQAKEENFDDFVKEGQALLSAVEFLKQTK